MLNQAIVHSATSRLQYKFNLLLACDGSKPISIDLLEAGYSKYSDNTHIDLPMEDECNVNVKHLLVLSADDATWVVPEDMSKVIDDIEFVKLQPSRNISFVKMVCGKQVPQNHSMSGSDGYRKLQQLRNEAQQPKEDSGAASSLFQTEEKDSRAKKRERITKAEAEAARTHPKILDISLDGCEVKVLEATHPLEAVWAEATPEALSALIRFLRATGVPTSSSRTREG